MTVLTPAEDVLIAVLAIVGCCALIRLAEIATRRQQNPERCGDQIIDAHGVTWVTCELPKGHHWHRDRNQTWLKPDQVPTCAACEGFTDPKEPV